MVSRGAVVPAALLLALFVVSAAAGALSSQSLVIQVYSDGSASITQKLSVSSGSTQVEVPLLSSVIADVIATDQDGSPLSFNITGSNITIYTVGATEVTLSYLTLNLTSKVGGVWAVAFEAEFNSTVVLPAGSTLTYVSGTPYSLGVQGTSPVVDLAPGGWRVEYGVPLGNYTAITSSTTTGTQGTGRSLLPYLAAVVAAAALLVSGALFLRRRASGGIQEVDLRPDDLKVLNFIKERGGKVLEPEVRTRFALPKTSAWRQIKRLERLGYVRVIKAGSQNQIELIKNKEAGVG